MSRVKSQCKPDIELNSIKGVVVNRTRLLKIDQFRTENIIKSKFSKFDKLVGHNEKVFKPNYFYQLKQWTPTIAFL